MQNDNARNTIIFVVSTVAILSLYQIFVLQPTAERRKAALQAEAPQAPASAAGASGAPTAAQVQGFVSRDAAAAASERAPVRTPLLSGSDSLTGARIDDLFMTAYRETTDAGSPAVELFRPEGAEHAYFAQFGWVGQNVAGLPGPATPWRLAGGRTLTPSTPLVLEHASPEGLTFTKFLERSTPDTGRRAHPR